MINQDHPDLTVTEILRILDDLQANGFGDRLMTVRGEYTITDQYEIEADAIDFCGNA